MTSASPTIFGSWVENTNVLPNSSRIFFMSPIMR